MTTTEVLLAIAFTLWLMVCVFTATLKGRAMGWGVAAAFLPPLYLVVLKLAPRKDTKSERVRCPLCKLGWVQLDRLPRVCRGCGKEITYAQLSKELHKDMTD